VAQIEAALAPDGPVAELVDTRGRVYAEMRLVRVEFGAERSRGRVVSQAFEARFLRLIA
jgi:hypothetical protein